MLLKHYLVLIFLLLTLLCHTQDPSYINYDTKDGLPSSEVYDVEVGPKGLVWFTSDRGIFSYDGYSFKTYTTKDGLADNTNFKIFKDSKDRLWFSGYNGGLTIYEDGEFRSYKYNDSLLVLLEGSWLDDFVEDEDGRIIASKVLTESMKLLSFGNGSYPRVVNELTKKFESCNCYLSFINNGGLVIWKKTHFPSSYSANMITRMGNKYIYSIEDTLITHDLKDNSTKRLLLQERSLKLVVEDSSIWICSLRGVSQIVEDKIGRLKIKNKYFSEFRITGLGIDDVGNYWFTTLQSGIVFVPSYGVMNERFLTQDNLFLAIAKMKKNIIFSNSNIGVHVFNHSGEHNFIKTKQYIDVQIMHLIESGGFVNYQNIELFEEENEVLIELLDIEGSPQYNYELNNGEIIGFVSRGFRVLDSNLILIKLKSELNFYQKLNTVIQTKDEQIWIATLKGLFSIKNYNYSQTDAVLINNQEIFGRINDIHIDSTENLWLATIGNGLFYHTENGTYQISEEDGLLSDIVNHALVTNDSTVWIATNKGVNQFNYHYSEDCLEIYNMKSLSTIDGLCSNYINDVDYWNGEIWLATNDGISHFDPDVINRKYPMVPINIDEFIVNDSSYLLSGDHILEYTENDVFIRFTGISFLKNDTDDFYKYRLIKNGKASKWSFSGERNVRYNDLPYGKYTFEVNAQNRSKHWNDNPARVSFTINPHYTQTGWFLFSLFLFGIGLVFLLLYYRILGIRKKEEQKRRLLKAESDIREAQLSSLRNQMNPHFVFNSLNAIQNYIFKNDSQKANYYMSKFAKLMRNSLQYTRMDLITLAEELDFIENYLELEIMRFPDKFKYSIDIDDDLAQGSIFVPSLLLQPILENVIKHAFKDIKYIGELEIEIKIGTNDNLEISIQDNGPGLVREIKVEEIEGSMHNSLGIEIIKNRIKLFNEANPQSNASVLFVNRQEINSTETGLKVLFTLPTMYNS